MPSSFFQSRRNPFAPQPGTGNDQYTTTSPQGRAPAAWQLAGNYGGGGGGGGGGGMAGAGSMTPPLAAWGEPPLYSQAMGLARNPVLPNFPMPQLGGMPQMPDIGPAWQPPTGPSPGDAGGGLAAQLQALIQAMQGGAGGPQNVTTGIGQPNIPAMPQAQAPAVQPWMGPASNGYGANIGVQMAPLLDAAQRNWYQGASGIQDAYQQALGTAGLGWGELGSQTQRTAAQLPIMEQANLLSFLQALYRPQISQGIFG